MYAGKCVDGCASVRVCDAHSLHVFPSGPWRLANDDVAGVSRWIVGHAKILLAKLLPL